MIGPMISSVASRVNYWRQVGMLKGIKFGGENKYLYYKPTEAEVDQIRQRRQKHGVQPTGLNHRDEAQ